MSTLTDEEAEKMARARYAKKCERPDPHAVFMRWATWEQACRVDGWLAEALTEERAAYAASPAPSLLLALEEAAKALEPFADVCFGRESFGDMREMDIDAPPRQHLMRARLLMREYRQAASALAAVRKAMGKTEREDLTIHDD